MNKKRPTQKSDTSNHTPDWTKPHEVSDLDLAFPARISHLMPSYDSIPEEFKRDRTEWNRIVVKWFYEGLPQESQFYPKEGIDPKKAFRHLKAVLGSFEPKHEHKMAAVPYLLSLWFSKAVIPEAKK